MQFSGKISQIIGCRPPLGLAPPPLGNPGSTTGHCNLSHHVQANFSQTKLAILTLLSTLCECIAWYLQFSSLFTSTDASKYEIRNQEVYEADFSMLNALLDQLTVMAVLKQNWQPWHSCIVGSLWRTRIGYRECQAYRMHLWWRNHCLNNMTILEKTFLHELRFRCNIIANITNWSDRGSWRRWHLTEWQKN